MLNIKHISDTARCWVFQSNRELSADEIKQANEQTQLFVSKWAAHGAKLSAFAEVYYNRFLVIFADENSVKASGCSIDTLMQHVQQLQQELKTDFFDRLQIAYLQNEQIHTCTITEFETLLNKGVLNGNTPVINNMITTKAEFERSWQTPVKNSWHSRYLPVKKNAA